jgi:hypothetical protein
LRKRVSLPVSRLRPETGLWEVSVCREFYGNLATYMHMKNIVPPSSEQPPAPPQAPKK